MLFTSFSIKPASLHFRGEQKPTSGAKPDSMAAPPAYSRQKSSNGEPAKTTSLSKPQTDYQKWLEHWALRHKLSKSKLSFDEFLQVEHPEAAQEGELPRPSADSFQRHSSRFSSQADQHTTRGGLTSSSRLFDFTDSPPEPTHPALLSAEEHAMLDTFFSNFMEEDL